MFALGVGTNTEVTLEGGLVEDPRVRRTSNGAALSGAAEDWVASFIPITVHGQLDTGETVTLLNAHSHGSDGEFFGLPRYRAHTVMFGSHVPSIDQLVTAVRFRAGHPYWLAHLQDGDTYRHDDGSTLSVEGADDGNWLVYTPPDPMRLRRLEITAVSGSLVLMELALDQTVVTRDTQVRIEADGPWIAVHGGGFSAPASDFSPDSLLPRGELTVELLGLVGSGVVECGARGRGRGGPFLYGLGYRRIPAGTTTIGGLATMPHNDFTASFLGHGPPTVLDQGRPARPHAAPA